MFDLEKFQNDLFQPAQDMLSQNGRGKTDSLPRKKIVDLYKRCRAQNRLTATAYKALCDRNKFVKLAALDLMTTFVDERSIDYLFKALEDEEDVTIRQKIAETIDAIEAKIKKTYSGQAQISVSKTINYG
ncbi:MAG: hypothetical protein D6732_14380 [Methanobacteriota archaeon]|nr:MAG: hypothetical protein D6732_14380 [Euryarchaeota archaeon]